MKSIAQILKEVTIAMTIINSSERERQKVWDAKPQAFEQ